MNSFGSTLLYNVAKNAVNEIGIDSNTWWLCLTSDWNMMLESLILIPKSMYPGGQTSVRNLDSNTFLSISGGECRNTLSKWAGWHVGVLNSRVLPRYEALCPSGQCGELGS